MEFQSQEKLNSTHYRLNKISRETEAQIKNLIKKSNQKTLSYSKELSFQQK